MERVLAGALTALVVGSLGGYLLFWPARLFRPAFTLAIAEPPETGPVASEGLKALRERAERAPCDRDGAIELGALEVREGRPEAALAVAARFSERCPDQAPLELLRFDALLAAKRFDEAMAVLSGVLAKRPDFVGGFWRRGRLHEQAGAYDAAVADYRQALVWSPGLTDVSRWLSVALERAEKPCEALTPLDQLVALHPDMADEPRIATRMRALRERCGVARSSGEAQLRYALGTLRLDVAAVGEGGGAVPATAAPRQPFVVLDEEAATTLKARPGGHDIRIRVGTAVTRGRLTRVPTLTLGGAVARRVEVVVVASLAGGDRLLLGASFLVRFDYRLDHEAGTLILTAPGKAAVSKGGAASGGETAPAPEASP